MGLKVFICRRSQARRCNELWPGETRARDGWDDWAGNDAARGGKTGPGAWKQLQCSAR